MHDFEPVKVLIFVYIFRGWFFIGEFAAQAVIRDRRLSLKFSEVVRIDDVEGVKQGEICFWSE